MAEKTSAEAVVSAATNVAETVSDAATTAAQNTLDFEVFGVYAVNLVLVIAFMAMVYYFTAPVRRLVRDFIRAQAARHHVLTHVQRFLDALPMRAVDAQMATRLARWHWGAITAVVLVVIAYGMTFVVGGAMDVIATAVHVGAALLVARALLALNAFRHKRIIKGQRVQRRFNVFFVDILLRRVIYAATLAYIIGIFHGEDFTIFSVTIPSDYFSLSALAVFVTTVFSPAVLWRLFNRHIGYPGDYIVLRDKDIAGTLVSMTLSHTLLRMPDGAMLTVPNKDMIGVVENRTARRVTRYTMTADVNAAALSTAEVRDIPEHIAVLLANTDDVDIVFVRWGDIVRGAHVLHIVCDLDTTDAARIDVLVADIAACVYRAVPEVLSAPSIAAG